MQRILLLSTCRPEPGYGAGERTLSIYNALSKLADVDVLLIPPPNIRIAARPSERVVHLLDDPDNATRWYWRRRAYLLADFRTDRNIAGVVDILHRENEYSAFFGRYHLPFLARCTRLGASFIDVDDVPTDSWSSRVPFVNAVRRSAFFHALALFKTVFVTKRADISKVRHTDVRVLPCISTRPDNTGPIPLDGTDQRMLFVGGTTWAPNREGVSRFIERCLPRIRKKLPAAVLRVVGAQGTAIAGPPGVCADDFVPDLVPEYQRAAICICPIRRGAGAEVKLAEAAAYGRAIVATPFAARGYEGILKPGRDLLVAESDEEFADRCIELLQDESLRTRLSANARDAASELLNQSAVDRIILDALRPWLDIAGKQWQRRAPDVR
jgi:glycosyltransferase involved in cell wall biosynthesis